MGKGLLNHYRQASKVIKIGDEFYDFGTSNTSFLQVAKDLKTNNIKNYYFHLRLLDPSLVGINPHAPNLPPDLIRRVISECVANPWYFLREVSLIPDEGGPSVRFRLNRAALATIWCFINGINCYLTIARQIGKTKSILAILLWAFLFGTSNSEFLFLHIEAGGSTGNLATMQANFVVDDDGKMKKGTNNVHTTINPINGNKVLCLGKANSKEKAMELGRGKSQPIQYIDESEFISWITEILGACGPAFGTSSLNAKANGAVHGRIFTSTPGDLDNPHAALMIDYIKNGCVWSEKFYDMKLSDVEIHIKTSALNAIVYIEYPYYLLGKDRAWFEMQKGEVLNDPVRIKRELLLRRIHGSSDSPFKPEDLDVLYGKKGKIVDEIFIAKIYKFTLYELLDPQIPYFVGIDPSQSYGQDNNYIIIFNPFTGKVAGSFKSPHISPTQFPRLIIKLVKDHIPRAILIPERNIGAALVSALLEDPHTKSRMYYEKGKTFDTSQKESNSGSGFLEEEASFRRSCGILTDKYTRPEMFRLLGTYVSENKDAFVDHTLIDEVMTLVKRNNKIQASSGKHDDAVMAFLMCLFVLIHGKNLSRFGFDPEIAKIMVENMHKGVDAARESVRLEEERKALQAAQGELAKMGFGTAKTQNDYEMDIYNEIMRAKGRVREEVDYAHDNVMETRDISVRSGYASEDNGLVNMDLAFFDDVNDW